MGVLKNHVIFSVRIDVNNICIKVCVQNKSHTARALLAFPVTMLSDKEQI